MNDSLKHLIEEAFASKKQQRYFYAKASDKSEPKKERKKWKKWAKEFSNKTDFKKLPETAEEVQMDEIVDEDGNIARGSYPSDYMKKGITTKKTSDEFARAVGGQMGGAGLDGGGNAARLMRYFGESDMSGALGYDETMAADLPRDEAEDVMTNELGLDDEEANERLDAMGYLKHAPKGVVRLVENPLKFVEDYTESVLQKRSKVHDVVQKDDGEIKEINPIIKKQIDVVKQALKDNGIPLKMMIKYLKDNE